MGLLDWEDDQDDFAFPDFASSFSPNENSKPFDEAFGGWTFQKTTTTTEWSLPESTPPSSPRERSDSTSTSSSTSSSESRATLRSRMSIASPASMASMAGITSQTPTTPSKPRSKHRRRSRQVKATARRRQSSFDLFGDDNELQEAESKIGFCDICLKHCNVH